MFDTFAVLQLRAFVVDINITSLTGFGSLQVISCKYTDSSFSDFMLDT